MIEEIQVQPARAAQLVNVDPQDRQEIFQLLLDQSDCKDHQEKEVSLDLQVPRVLKDSEVLLVKLDHLELLEKMVPPVNEVLKAIEVIVELLV